MRLIACMLVALSLVAGCGGDDDAADTTTDVNRLLDESFVNAGKIESGRIDFSARVEGPAALTVELSGPFQSEGDGRLPRLDVDAALEGSGQRLEAGVTSTGDQGFVSFQGTDYEVSEAAFRQLQAAYEEAQKQASEQQEGTSLATLGVDPRRWLRDPRIAGESEVGGTETTKITAGVDVSALLDDLNVALERARSLGLQGSEELPEQLSDQQKREIVDTVERATVEIHTGADDRVLRRLVVAADLAAEGETLGIRADLSLLDVGEDQEIEAPENPRPFQELVAGLEELGLGGLGGAGGSGSGSGGGASSENLEEYSQCVQDAGGDTDRLRECGELLTP